MFQIDRRIFAHFDFELLALGLLIPLFGLVVLYSAGYDSSSPGVSLDFINKTIYSIPFVKQAAFIGVGFIAMIVGMSISGQSLYRFAYVIYGVVILCLVGVLLFGIVSHGSRRWFSLGGVNFQPSELAKLAVIFATARFMSKQQSQHGGLTFKKLILPSMIFVVPMLLVARQPDLGTALSIGAVGASMLLFVGIRPKVLLMLSIALAVAVVPAWQFLHPYQKRRVLSLINPESDPLGSGYHVTQSKIAVGSGAFSGKGFLKGTQSQLEFLPEHTTDFVFSVLAEEWGFLGSTFVLSMYLLLLLLMLRVVLRSRDFFSSLVVFGIATLFFFHTIVNIGMVIGVLPVVGLTLPLFSYGGSSLLVFMFALGIVLGMGMRRYQFTQ